MEVVAKRSSLKNITRELLTLGQYGFPPGRSITSQLLSSVSEKVKALNEKAQTDDSYISCAKAFDVIDHPNFLHPSHLDRLKACEEMRCYSNG